MKRFRRIGLSLVLAVALLAALALPVGATNPVVQITVTAELVSITNSEDTWAVGTVALDAVVYFSATGAEDVDYSLVTNIGSVAVDVAIEGTDIDGTAALDWTLAATAGVETYSLYAYNVTAATYTIQVKSSAYTDLCWNLPATGSDTQTWSMKFTAPSAFDAAEDGLVKAATVTLVASKH